VFCDRVREHNVRGLAVEIFAQVTAPSRHSTCDPVRLRIRCFSAQGIIGAGAQHVNFVIGLDDQGIRAAKAFRRQRVDVAQIHRHALTCMPAASTVKASGSAASCGMANGTEPERPDLEVLRRGNGLAAAHQRLLVAQFAGFTSVASAT
jgi:hypothetical protein